jgi:hypothetical protein
MQANLFTFDPHASDAPLARGRHEVEIVAAEARTSRAGNPMLDMTYRAMGRQGEVLLKDYLVATARSRWKIRHFCEALGIDFDKGQIDPPALIGRRINVEVGVEDDGQGHDRNIVSDYAGLGALPRNGNGKSEGPAGRRAADDRREAVAGRGIGGEDIPF